MQQLNVNDRVRIIKANPDEPKMLDKTGKIVLISDGVNYVVLLDDGSSAMVSIDQLKKII